MRVRDGVRVAFDLWYSSDDSSRQAISNEFSNEMAELGIEVSPRGGSWDEIYQHQFEQPVLWGWGQTRRLRSTSCITRAVGAITRATRARSSTAIWTWRTRANRYRGSYPYWKKAMWDGEEGVAPQGAATRWIANVDHLYWKRKGLDVAGQKPHPHGDGRSLVNNVDRWTWA